MGVPCGRGKYILVRRGQDRLLADPREALLGTSVQTKDGDSVSALGSRRSFGVVRTFPNPGKASLDLRPAKPQGRQDLGLTERRSKGRLSPDLARVFLVINAGTSPPCSGPAAAGDAYGGRES